MSKEIAQLVIDIIDALPANVQANIKHIEVDETSLSIEFN